MIERHLGRAVQSERRGAMGQLGVSRPGALRRDTHLPYIKAALALIGCVADDIFRLSLPKADGPLQEGRKPGRRSERTGIAGHAPRPRVGFPHATTTIISPSLSAPTLTSRKEDTHLRLPTPPQVRLANV